MRELLEQALNELNGTVDTCVDDLVILCDKIKTKLKTPGEPVAIIGSDYRLLWTAQGVEAKGFKIGDKLYAAPPQREPLSEEEILRIFKNIPCNAPLIDKVRAVEKALGITGEQS